MFHHHVRADYIDDGDRTDIPSIVWEVLDSPLGVLLRSYSRSAEVIPLPASHLLGSDQKTWYSHHL